LYQSLGAKLPAIVTLLLSISDWTVHFGIYLLIIVAAIVGGIIFYIKTPPGRLRWDRLVLKLPIVGRITLLNELARCCRTMALLINVGLAMPEILTITIQSSSNKIVVQSLTEVQRGLIRGEGISGPMSRRPVFLPLMVAMVAVGEETGKLSNTLNTVAESFEVESDDKTTAATGLIQPVLTIVIAIVVGFIALVMFSAMYSIYGQFNG
jgi:type IV pilus assembly protein PilC